LSQIPPGGSVEGFAKSREAIVEHRYTVEGMTCQHCVDAVSREVAAVRGVSGVVVDLGAHTVVVAGGDDAAVRAAIDEAGYTVSS
jgi:copper chaperone